MRAIVALLLVLAMSSCGFGLSASASIPGPRPFGGYYCRSEWSPDAMVCYPDYGPPRRCWIMRGRWVCR